jgi:hypothetical protein
LIIQGKDSFCVWYSLLICFYLLLVSSHVYSCLQGPHVILYFISTLYIPSIYSISLFIVVIFKWNGDYSGKFWGVCFFFFINFLISHIERTKIYVWLKYFKNHFSYIPHLKILYFSSLHAFFFCWLWLKLFFGWYKYLLLTHVACGL